MLILHRKVNQGIVLCLPDGREACVYILDVEEARHGGPHGRAKVGIEAPDDVRIRRNELDVILAPPSPVLALADNLNDPARNAE